MTKRTGVLIGAGVGVAAVLAHRLTKQTPPQALTGEVALITGGSRGLGLALAREFAAHGCRIAICARNRNEMDRAVADLESRGAQAFGYPCDVGKKDEVEHLLAAVTAHYGGVDILVNNAGIIEVGPVQNLETRDFEEAMNTIFWGTLHPTLAALPAFLKRQSGRIVNIASIAGEVSVPHLLPYTSAKFAAAGFSQGLAVELRSQGVAVTTVYPGLLRTGSFVQAKFKGQQQAEANWFTLGAGMPGVSMNVDRAARQIVQAVRRGQTQLTLSLPAQLLAAMNKMFPGGTSEILSTVNSALLPKPAKSGDKIADTAVDKIAGRYLLKGLNPGVRMLAALGFQAMRNYNQKL